MASKPNLLDELDHDIRVVRRGLVAVGVPGKLITAIGIRALRSGRRQTGSFTSNRAARWRLDPRDPQFGTEADCKVILLRLLGMLMEFKGAPPVDSTTGNLLRKYLGKAIEPGTYRDVLTKERLDYSVAAAEAAAPKRGVSSLHLGHDDPTAVPRHTPDNVSWRSERSNLLQGNLTLPQARSRFVEIIARYFELGEIRIDAD